MNLGTIGKIAIGVGVGVGAVALLAACSEKNEDKTSEGVAGDVTRRYDRDMDSNLDIKFEATRDVPGSRCTWSADYDNDGYAETCLVTDNYVNRYSVAALLNRADNAHGNKDGTASQDEIAGVVKEFDTGTTKDGVTTGAGDNILSRDEIKNFNRSYEEQYQGEIG